MFTLASIHRKKRAILENSKNTCKMLVVADHRFFKYMGRGEESTTINYLVSKDTLLQFAGINAGKNTESVVKRRYILYYFCTI